MLVLGSLLDPMPLQGKLSVFKHTCGHPGTAGDEKMG